MGSILYGHRTHMNGDAHLNPSKCPADVRLEHLQRTGNGYNIDIVLTRRIYIAHDVTSSSLLENTQLPLMDG